MFGVEYSNRMKDQIICQRKVNVIVPFIKLILAYSVAMNHFMGHPILVSGGMSVNLFFIISGFFLANSFSTEKYKSVGLYSLHRVKSFYKQYIVAFLLLFVLTVFGLGHYRFVEVMKTIIDSLPEVFLLQNVGWFDGGINYPLWFLCNLIVVSHILFALLKYNAQLTVNVICPVIVLLFGAYYANAFGDHEVLTWGIIGKFIYIPLFRTACFLSIGIMLFYAKKRMDCELNINSLIAILLFVINLSFFILAGDTTKAYIPFIILLLSTFYITYSDNLYNFLCKVRKNADDLSLVIFFNQVLIIRILNEIGFSSEGGGGLTCLFIVWY